MKTIGLLGGMSWESTIPYYRLINEGIKARLGGLHSASLLLHRVDFHEIDACQSSGDWQRAGEILTGLKADAAIIKRTHKLCAINSAFGKLAQFIIDARLNFGSCSLCCHLANFGG